MSIIDNVTPIPKSTGSGTPCGYRPISLLSILSKMLERHIAQLLLEHLATHHPLSLQQWGFQTGKCTTTALIHVTDHWLQELEQSHEICAIFFDLQKAFDSVPHRALLAKLHSLGLNSYLQKWICHYLLDRKQRVILNGTCSELATVYSGVPQGSVLGPLLFLIYFDGITQIPITRGSFRDLYADDLLLYRVIREQRDFTFLQSDIDSVADWIDGNFLTLNGSKCKMMVISRRHQQSLPEQGLFLQNEPLELVEEYRYLGIILNSTLNWSAHIESICRKARHIVGMLYRTFYIHANSSSLIQLYLSLVRPHLEYGCAIWDPYTRKDINQFEGVQKFALRVGCKQWSTSYEDLLSLTNIPELKTRRTFLKLCI